MKLFCEAVVVQTGGDGQPNMILWRAKPYRVQDIQEIWEWRGRWWETPALCGYRRRYFRLLCKSSQGQSLCLEVYRQRGRWTLSRILD